ncbi:MAG: PepSY-like domain-containing protein [Bacteroidota bacterium]
MKHFFFCLLVLFCASSMYGQKLKSADVPAAVKTAFEKAYPNATKVNWEKEDTGYEAEFKIGSKDEQSIVFDASGKWLEKEIEINKADLPAPVLAALKGKRIKEASKITKADGTVLYEAEVKHKDLLFDGNGKPVM